MPPVLRRLMLNAASLAALATASTAVAGDWHGYPPTVRAGAGEAERYGWWAQGGADEDSWSPEAAYAAAPAGPPPEMAREVGYLPLSFFADAGGVGPYPTSFDEYGGYVFGGGEAGAFAGARVSARISASARIFGGVRMRGGGHGCGCK